MSFSLPAVLACTFFYSALYLIYYYFAQYSHTLLIVSAIVLLILAWRITPCAYERGQRSFKRDSVFWTVFLESTDYMVATVYLAHQLITGRIQT